MGIADDIKLAAANAIKFTATLVPLVEHEFAVQEKKISLAKEAIIGT